MKREEKNKHLGGLELPNAKIAIVVAEFNKDITERLLDGALETLKEAKLKETNVEVVWVPGSFEIPYGAMTLAKRKKYDGIITLGCVIKGGTDHYHHVSGQASSGIMKVMLDYATPIGFGVIIVNNLKQAKDRSSAKDNKGREAAEAVLSIINIFKNK